MAFPRICSRVTGAIGALAAVSLAVNPTTRPLSPSTRETLADGAIVIEAAPAVVKRVMFDRFHKTPDMPKLEAGEAALTRSEYQCGAYVRYSIVDKKQTDSGWHVTTHVDSLTVKTSLVDTIFLPQMAPIELRAHEEGHRAMNERVYREGDDVVKKVAVQVLARDWSGDGENVDAASKAATDRAVNELCDEYLRHTGKRASVLGDEYDKMTSHGRNAMLVSMAMRASFAEEAKQATTQPATTQISLRE